MSRFHECVMLFLVAVFLFIMVCFISAHAQTVQTPTQISWTHVSGQDPNVDDNEDGFVIERNLNGGAFTANFIAVGANVLSTTDANVQQSTVTDNVYCYRAFAFNKTGKSAYSNTACRTIARFVPPQTPPNDPTNLILNWQQAQAEADAALAALKNWKP